MICTVTIALIGCSRGIGYGLAKVFLEKTNAKVIATARDPGSSEILQALVESYGQGRIVTPALDTKVDSSFRDLKSLLPAIGVHCIDILIGNAAISNPEHPHDPILECVPEEMMDIFNTNVVGNMRLIQTFNDMVAASTLKTTLFMTSSLGSHNHAAQTGGVTGYRVSKSALNMLAVLYAQEPSVREAGVKVLLMHPGWVKTDMGLARDQPAKIDLDTSTEGILKILERVAVNQLHKFGYHVKEDGPKLEFSEGNDKIESRSFLNEMLEKLEHDNFVYTTFEGKILKW